eukprot:Skav226991  [mRNA]  locus=scaffold2341:264250:265813:+ [translate_table: standard]
MRGCAVFIALVLAASECHDGDCGDGTMLLQPRSGKPVKPALPAAQFNMQGFAPPNASELLAARQRNRSGLVKKKTMAGMALRAARRAMGRNKGQHIMGRNKGQHIADRNGKPVKPALPAPQFDMQAIATPNASELVAARQRNRSGLISQKTMARMALRAARRAMGRNKGQHIAPPDRNVKFLKDVAKRLLVVKQDR